MEAQVKYHPLAPEVFDSVLAVGSRIETWRGTWGTVTAIEDVETDGHVHSKIVHYRAEHTDSFDSSGWPVDGGPKDLMIEVRKFSSDLRYVSEVWPLASDQGATPGMFPELEQPIPARTTAPLFDAVHNTSQVKRHTAGPAGPAPTHQPASR